MPIYSVRFNMMGQGIVEVEAENEDHADSLVTDWSLEELIEATDFDGGLTADEVEKV